MFYHVAYPSLSIDALKDGMLIKTGLYLDSLNGSQLIQVFRRGGMFLAVAFIFSRMNA